MRGIGNCVIERVFLAGQEALVKESTKDTIRDTISSLTEILDNDSDHVMRWAADIKVITVELKVPCDFRPIREALLDLLVMPQSDLCIFFNEDVLFSDEVKGALEERLQEAGIPSTEALLTLLANTLNSPSMLLTHRLKCIQCWCARETSHLVLQLYKCLGDHLGEDSVVEKVLSQIENFELCTGSHQDLPCSEAGIAVAVQQMYKVLAQVRTQEWDEGLEQEVTKMLSRFLLGHLVGDLRCVFSIVQMTSPAPEVEKALAACHFAAVDSMDLFNWQIDSPQWRGHWLRTSVVDAKMKSSSVASEGAKELERLSLNSHGCFEKANATVKEGCDLPRKASSSSSQFEPMGGHAEDIMFDADLVWKRGPRGSKGLAELAFLKLSLDFPDISQFVPRLIDVHFKDEEMWLGMKNALYGFEEPAVMDVKIGYRTHPPDSCGERAAKREQKASETTSSKLGFRVVGAKFLGPEGSFQKVGYKHNINIGSEDVIDLFSKFFCTDALISSSLQAIDEIAAWMKLQRKFAFYSSSLLFAYDTRSADEVVVRLIDFANMRFIQSKEEDVSGFQNGLTTLRSMLNSCSGNPIDSPPEPNEHVLESPTGWISRFRAFRLRGCFR